MPRRSLDTPTPASPAWHALDLAAVASRREADPARGLGAAEAARRLALHGDNALDAAAAVPWWWKVLKQLKALRESM